MFDVFLLTQNSMKSWACSTCNFRSYLQRSGKGHLVGVSGNANKIKGGPLVNCSQAQAELKPPTFSQQERSIYNRTRMDYLKTTFRHTVINLTEDIWESPRWPGIVTLVFWPETRHRRNCLPAQGPLFAITTASSSFSFLFFLEQFSEKHLHRDVPKETTLTSQLSWRRFLESKFHLAQIMGGKQRRPR